MQDKVKIKTEILTLFKDDGKAVKFCKICGKPITERTSHNLSYCSEKCARRAEGRKRREYIEKRANAIKNVKSQVLYAFDYKCRICGWQASDDLYIEKKKSGEWGKIHFSYGCEIHHIIPACDGGRETNNNLILLCPNHHKQANMGIITPSELVEHLKGLIPEEDYLSAKKKCEELYPVKILTPEEKEAEEYDKASYFAWQLLRKGKNFI